MTVNDGPTVRRLRAHFAEHLDAELRTPEPEGGSEDFSVVPDAFGAPHVYWGLGAFDADDWRRAEEAGTEATDFPTPHAATFAPVLQPTLDTGVSAPVTAALGWVGKQDG